MYAPWDEWHAIADALKESKEAVLYRVEDAPSAR
jgi:hypothetical protein